MRGFQNLALVSTSLLLLAAAGCDAEEPTDTGNGSACDGGKCDTPTGNDEQCKLRQAEVLDSTNRGFTRTDIRWACADVAGVNTVGRDDRGQEYCEYFAIFQPPAEEEGADAPRLSTSLGTPATGSIQPPRAPFVSMVTSATTAASR